MTKQILNIIWVAIVTMILIYIDILLAERKMWGFLSVAIFFTGFSWQMFVFMMNQPVEEE